MLVSNMPSLVQALGVFLVSTITLSWLLVSADGRKIPCGNLVLSADVESVNNCSAQATLTSDLTKVFVDACGEYKLCDTSCRPARSEQTLNYSLTEFSARSDYRVVNQQCINTVSLKWKLRRNLSASANKIIGSAAIDSSEATERSSSSSEENVYSSEISGSYENFPTDNNNTIAFKICIFIDTATFCALAAEVRAQIPNTDAQTIEFQYDCLSFNGGHLYQMIMYTYPQLSEGMQYYKTQIYVTDTPICKLPNSPIQLDIDEAYNSTGEKIEPLPPSKPINDGLLTLICVISVTILMIIILTSTLIVVSSIRAKRRQLEAESRSTGSNSPLISGDCSDRPVERGNSAGVI